METYHTLFTIDFEKGWIYISCDSGETWRGKFKFMPNTFLVEGQGFIWECLEVEMAISENSILINLPEDMKMDEYNDGIY